MHNQLGPEQIDAYQRDGFLSPRPVFAEDEVRQLRKQFEDFELRFGGIERAVSRRTDLHLLTG